MQHNFHYQSETSTLPKLIAWLSICLLSAAWGHALAPSLRTVWAEIGLFGLSASVGLGVLEKSRWLLKERQERAAYQLRADRYLAEFMAKSEALARDHEPLVSVMHRDQAQSAAPVFTHVSLGRSCGVEGGTPRSMTR